MIIFADTVRIIGGKAEWHRYVIDQDPPQGLNFVGSIFLVACWKSNKKQAIFSPCPILNNSISSVKWSNTKELPVVRFSGKMTRCHRQVTLKTPNTPAGSLLQEMTCKHVYFPFNWKALANYESQTWMAKGVHYNWWYKVSIFGYFKQRLIHKNLLITKRRWGWQQTHSDNKHTAKPYPAYRLQNSGCPNPTTDVESNVTLIKERVLLVTVNYWHVSWKDPSCFPQYKGRAQIHTSATGLYEMTTNEGWVINSSTIAYYF